uniref:Uncharacterized protein n=1 Tax=Macrostomum lignano TaxID=282301 RepID=A0A1I8FGP1_9PLAT
MARISQILSQTATRFVSQPSQAAQISGGCPCWCSCPNEPRAVAGCCWNQPSWPYPLPTQPESAGLDVHWLKLNLGSAWAFRVDYSRPDLDALSVGTLKRGKLGACWLSSWASPPPGTPSQLPVLASFQHDSAGTSSRARVHDAGLLRGLLLTYLVRRSRGGWWLRRLARFDRHASGQCRLEPDIRAGVYATAARHGGAAASSESWSVNQPPSSPAGHPIGDLLFVRLRRFESSALGLAVCEEPLPVLVSRYSGVFLLQRLVWACALGSVLSRGCRRFAASFFATNSAPSAARAVLFTTVDVEQLARAPFELHEPGPRPGHFAFQLHFLGVHIEQVRPNPPGCLQEPIETDSDLLFPRRPRRVSLACVLSVDRRTAATSRQSLLLISPVGHQPRH